MTNSRAIAVCNPHLGPSLPYKIPSGHKALEGVQIQSLSKGSESMVSSLGAMRE